MSNGLDFKTTINGDTPVSAANPLPVTDAASAADLEDIKVAVQIVDDWDESDRAKVNVIVGQAGIAAGTGVDGATVPRVSLATNVALPAGTNLLGKVGIDQTTDGTTNKVAVGGAAAIVSSRKVTAAAGTAIVLGTSLPCREVQVTALPTNTSYIAVGGTATLATAGSEAGVILAPGQGAVFTVSNVNVLYVDSLVTGEGLSFNYLT